MLVYRAGYLMAHSNELMKNAHAIPVLQRYVSKGAPTYPK